MADKITKDQRSKIMARIKSANTIPEIFFRKLLSNNHIRGYRLHAKVSGKPDIAFISKKIAIFIDGDFWHGYNWKNLNKIPPKKYWQKKIKRTMQRDKRYTRHLRKEGWCVLRFWEHEIKRHPKRCLEKVKKKLLFSLF